MWRGPGRPAGDGWPHVQFAVEAAVILMLKPLLTALFLRAGAVGGLLTHNPHV